MSGAKKVCVLGMFGVGKSSLVDRIAYDRFSADYKTTIGVRPVPATLNAGSNRAQRIVLWDIAGESDVSRLTRAYLVGSDGFMIVMDGLRRESVEIATRIEQSCRTEYPNIPIGLIVNKVDMETLWEMRLGEIAASFNAPIFHVSARSGAGVQHAIEQIISQPAGK